jgi:predicted metal-dependent RNase
MNYLLEALIKKLEGEIEVHKANVMVYVKNPAGIGEHSDVVESIEKEIEKVADAEDKIEAIMKHFKY